MQQYPLLNFTKELFPDIDLSEVTILGVHHILEVVEHLLEIFYDKGLRRENMYLLGKCYSTSKLIFNNIDVNGVFISPLGYTFDSHESFDIQYNKYIKDFLQEAKKARKGRLQQNYNYG